MRMSPLGVAKGMCSNLWMKGYSSTWNTDDMLVRHNIHNIHIQKNIQTSLWNWGLHKTH